jgi:hypothetical protein
MHYGLDNHLIIQKFENIEIFALNPDIFIKIIKYVTQNF